MDAGRVLDDSFAKTTHDIQQRLQLLGRVPRVRVAAWLTKLSQDPTANQTWKRNRNAYARLLLQQLRAGVLEVPFHTLPGEGGLPTLPAYLTYRFASPSPQCQQHATYAIAGEASACWQQELCSVCSSADVQLAGVQCPLPRPRSAHPAGSAGDGPLNMSSKGSGSWRSRRASARQLGHLSVSPGACGSPPQQPWPGSSTLPPQRSPARPHSPGTAGLLDAASVLAAEIATERADARDMGWRLHQAEAKILQQEAELVRMQGQASAVRRRVKCATAATLGELLERYGSKAAVWAQPGVAGGSSSSSPTATGGSLAEGVAGPVWQLLNGLQSVLDSCDQRAQGAAAAEAIRRCYDAQLEDAAAAAAGGSSEQQQALDERQQLAAQAAAAAASSEVAVLVKLQRWLAALQEASGQHAASLLTKKDEATAAAGGQRGLNAADVAAGAGSLLQGMLQHLQDASQDSSKLHKRLSAAAAAAQEASASAQQLAAAAASSAVGVAQADSTQRRSSSSSCDSSSCSNEASSSAAAARRKRRTAGQQQLQQQQRELLSLAAQQQHQQQDARLRRLMAAAQLLGELDKAHARLSAQLQEAHQKLQDAVRTNSVADGSHHENGLLAAATAGIAASTAAGVRAFDAGITNLQPQLAALAKAAVAPAGAPEAAAVAAAASPTQLLFGSSRGAGISLSSPASGGSRAAAGLLSGSRIDAALAGTWASGSPPMGRASLSQLSQGLASPVFDAAAHYAVGAAAAAGAGTGSPQASPFFSAGSTAVVAAPGGDAAADAIHARLASLSRQASRVSARASELLSPPVSGGSTSGATTPISSPRGLLLQPAPRSAVNSLLLGMSSSRLVAATQPISPRAVSAAPPPGAATSSLLAGGGGAGAFGGSSLTAFGNLLSSGPAATGPGSSHWLGTSSLLRASAPGGAIGSSAGSVLGGLGKPLLLHSSLGGTPAASSLLGGSGSASPSSSIAAISSRLGSLKW